ncbi:MAG: UDP-glucose 4-epimerase GalE [bacterium]
MKILVTGGTGYIGSHIAVELLQRQMEVVIVDNLSNSSIDVCDAIIRITGQPFTFYQYDVLDEEKMRTVFETHKIDAVIHCAAFKAVGESVEKPIKYYINNLMSTLVIAKLMKEYHVPQIIFSSSATVYGDPETVPLTEDAKLGETTNPYGASKAMMERILTDVQKANPEMSVTLLRYFNPIGAHESGKIGEDPQGIPNNLMPYIMKVAAGELPYLRIFGNDYETKDGTGVRDYIHVVDLAIGHVLALKAYREPGVHITNLGTGQGYSVMEIVQAFERVNHIKVPYKVVARRPGDIAVCYADPSKAKKELQWVAERGIEDMCRDAWHFVETRRK